MEADVSRESNLFDFFHGHVDRAERDLDLGLDDDVRLYLAQLLAERARTDRDAPEAHTLVELHARAAHAPPSGQATTYRELGDRSLYLVGYFPENVERRAVTTAYYKSMGAAAYGRVDVVLKTWFRDAFGPVFAELAQRFEDCVAVLDRIRAEQESSPDPIARLYARWLETGDPETADRLRRRGLLLPPRPARA